MSLDCPYPVTLRVFTTASVDRNRRHVNADIPARVSCVRFGAVADPELMECADGSDRQGFVSGSDELAHRLSKLLADAIKLKPTAKELPMFLAEPIHTTAICLIEAFFSTLQTTLQL
jgi:hypothetical protein